MWKLTEEFDDIEPLCAAQEALLMVHTVILNAVASLGDSYKKDMDKGVPTSCAIQPVGKCNW